MTIPRGALLARSLRGSWRPESAPQELTTAELAEIAPLMMAAGTGGLGWWQIRRSPLSATAAGCALQQVFRAQALQGALQRQQIALVLTRLRQAGVEPLLAKGWAVTRHYAAAGLRPPGDIDLCVPPGQYRKAVRALGKIQNLATPVDLHCGLEHTGFSLMDDRALEELYARAELVPLDGMAVRVPSPEDHLRLICLHMLGHGARRPLWLCDVAAALEARPTGFDWELCLGGDRRRTEWVRAALLLAHRLLGARIDGTPLEQAPDAIPSWFSATVVHAWSTAYRYPRPMTAWRRKPRAALAEIRHRWPNGIEGMVAARGGLNGWPRWPYQLNALARRSAQFLRHLGHAGSL